MNDNDSNIIDPLLLQARSEHRTKGPGPVSANFDPQPEWQLSKTGFLLLGFGYLVLVVALYWRTLFTNFVYDDWLILGEFHRSGAWTSFFRHCDPSGSLIYRPLAWLYFAILYETFGVAPAPVHILHLIFLSLNGLLVAWIGARVTGRKVAGILAGAIYLTLVSLHLDTLIWMVGFYDIGAATFALLSFWLLMRERPAASAALMMCALLTKEAAAFLLPLFLLWAVLGKRPVRMLTYHAIGAVLYGGLKLRGLSPFAVERDSPHAMEVSVEVVAGRGLEYLQWLVSAFAPHVRFDALPGLGIIIVVLLCAAWIVARRRSPRAVPVKHLGFVAAWLVLALLPVLLLKVQAARYYGVHAAIPAALLASIMFVEIKDRVGQKWGSIVLFVFLAAIGAANALEVNRIFVQGMRQVIVNDGYFHLVKRAAAVDAIRDSLMARGQPFKPGTVILISGAPLDALGGSEAVRIWFRDSTLTVRRGARSDFQQSGQIPDSVFCVDLEAACAPLAASPPRSD